MTFYRARELMAIELECITRASAETPCNRDCANCDLVQDDEELKELYSGVIGLIDRIIMYLETIEEADIHGESKQ